MPRDNTIFDEVTANKRFKLPTGQNGIALLTLNSRGFLDSFDEAVTLDRYSPVVQKRIGEEYQKNIKLSGLFRTNYEHSADNPWGGYSFIQVRKNSTGKASAYSGYGIAWRPSVPDMDELIDISGVDAVGRDGYWQITCGNPDTDTEATLYLVQTGADLKTAYIPFQHEGYNGGALKGCYIPNATPSTSDKIALMSPNVYIVDNDPVHGDNYASRYIIDPLTGLSFIQAGTCLIEKDKSYYFEISIDGNNALSFKLKEADAVGDPADILSTGATVTLSEYLGGSNMDSLGLSVYDTNGYQWWYDDIKIEKLASEYAVMYFLMDVAGMPESLQIEITAAGSAPGQDGLCVEVWSSSLGEWVNILTYSNDAEATLISKTISKIDYAEESMITVRARSLGSSTASEPALISVDSIKVVRSTTPGVHIGGCVDVYVDDPEAQRRRTGISLATTGTYAGVGSYPNISKVTVAAGAELMYGVDYVIEAGDHNTYNSNRSEAILRVAAAHTGATLNITYWNSLAMESIADMLSSDDYKPVATDVLVRHKVIHEIVTDSYEQSLITYMDTLRYENSVKTISYSDFVKHIYNTTGIYASPKMIIHAFDGQKRRMAALTSMGQEYAINEIETFRIVS